MKKFLVILIIMLMSLAPVQAAQFKSFWHDSKGYIVINKSLILYFYQRDKRVAICMDGGSAAGPSDIVFTKQSKAEAHKLFEELSRWVNEK